MASALSDQYSALLSRFHYIKGELPDLERRIRYDEEVIADIEKSEPSLDTEEEMAKLKKNLDDLKERQRYFNALLVVLEYESEQKWKEYQIALTPNI
jgi:predicted  nucleic acid-binding Zn-ribbon protein